MQSHWYKGLTAAAIAALLLAGCGQKAMQGAGQAPKASTSQGSGSVSTPAAQTPAPTPTPEAQSKQLQVKAYFGDDQMEKLVEKQVTISFKQDADKYAAALQALTVSKDEKALPLMKGFTIKSAAIKNGDLTVDLSMPNESILGSGGEEMLLTAIQQTLFQFAEVKTIDILLDGKKVDSLMGHMELLHPIKRS
ncbi:GerMN domain-containing protein [Paenibacillus cremeus]|uniref:GerMN domain-containing protein n=1 Tax=Paenibacillus cremeus TaxID=2163881 RepID=A0A559KHP8_9BACL|nr:GerMN domain-containing protein [Paenibacillus cremeus]TVY11660.1 GerMN domain-containing protein [Paenibacillus cremeus]